MTQGERKPPGLPSVYQAKSDRERGRYSRGTPSLWLGLPSSPGAVFVGYRFVEERHLVRAKEALLAKERAVRVSRGRRVVSAPRRIEQDVLAPLGATAARHRRRRGCTLGLPRRSRASTCGCGWRTQGRHARCGTRGGGFAAGRLRRLLPPRAELAAARDVADAGAFAEQPWNWQRGVRRNAHPHRRLDRARSRTRAIPLRLRVFEQQYDKAMREEIPAAIDLVKRAQFFLFVLDEDSPDAHPAEAGAPLLEADLQQVAHFATVAPRRPQEPEGDPAGCGGRRRPASSSPASSR